jgi:2-polyprenyl-3-methyl-5-hydroxy-6-metoxy-1,4-benzoquinol methylase
MGCGTGRHTVALAQRGFAVSGVDISKGMLNVAADRAARAGVEVELIQRDARSFNGAERFDIVLSLCEGSMGLMEVDEDPHEHDAAVMAALYRSLRPGGVAVLNALNGLKLIRQYSDEDVAAGVFDPYQITETHPMEFELEGRTESVMVKEKAYLPFEFAELVREAGFTVDHIWGGTAGRWARRPLELDEYEMMVLAHR